MKSILLSVRPKWCEKILSGEKTIEATQIAMFQNVRAHAVKQFAEYLKEYARACKESGYEGIGEIDIDEKLKDFLSQ